MSTIKVSVAEIEKLAHGDLGTTRDGVELRVVDGADDWSSEGKYETCTVVFTNGERFYRSYASRSGSYYTDYMYDSEWNDGDADVEEVRKVTKTIEAWEAV
ncbi:hypothetical protein MJ749_14955 [Paenibacillus polymyxa]|uniref:hypothetical protein n=1 Tax=Paenibacillus polymyxa TaxID=1406 RepID=UPI001F0FF4BB|nr:hypothetical protein [Paenibacillus polymyxa]UMR33994.1 hypothetical protein MJ749_14955 [Paenibacillus polymyxa]